MSTEKDENIVYVKHGDEEITEDELRAVAGGAPNSKPVSKTIVVNPGYTDTDVGGF